MSESNSPGYIETLASSKKKTKENLRVQQVIPSEILEASGDTGIQLLLEKYYDFMNLNEFIYEQDETHTDLVLDGVARFRISDPNNENNQFYTDEQGSSSTLTIKGQDGNTATVALNSTNVAISNGNELPGSLRNSTSEIGKTMTISGLSAYNGDVASLTTPIKNWVGPGPSYVLNAIEDFMDIDKNSDSELDATHQYLEMMQKEIASAIPRGLLVNKNTLYKRIVDFYKVRGSSDSIETFFRLLFNEEVEIERPYDNTLIPSSGDWFSDTNQFISNKGFLSEKKIKIHDSYRYQKYSYLIKTGKNLTDWEYTFNRLVHPAGFIFFGEILILINMVRDALGDGKVEKGINVPTKNLETGLIVDQLVNAYGRTNRFTLSSMPGIQPGVIGAEDLPLLVEMFAAMFGPSPKALINKTAILSPVINSSGVMTAVEIVNQGHNYTSPPTITFSGTGTGAAATAVLNVEGGIDSITVDQGGSGYTEIAATVPAPASGAGKVGAMTYSTNANKLYRSPPIITLDAPTAVDQDGVLLASNVQATAEFVMEPTSVELLRLTNTGTNYTSEPSVTISLPTTSTNPATHYTATPFFTEDFENASVSTSNYDSWRVLGVNDHTVSIDSTEADTGSKSLKIQTSTLDTDASGSIGGAVRRLKLDAPEFVSRLPGDRIKVKVRAKKASSNGASFFKMAYSTNQHGNSGWQQQTLTTDWADYEFEYNISASTPTNEDYVGFQSDGSNGIVYIDNVSITAKFGHRRATARAIINDDGQVDGLFITDPGYGYLGTPTVQITGGGGGGAACVSLLTPTEIASINITNEGNGYVLDPNVKLGSSMVIESRAKETGMYLKVMLNHLLDGTRTIQDNNYFNNKGTSYYDSTKKFNLNQTIEQFGSQTIQSNNINSINRYNTNSFIDLN